MVGELISIDGFTLSRFYGCKHGLRREVYSGLCRTVVISRRVATLETEWPRSTTCFTAHRHLFFKSSINDSEMSVKPVAIQIGRQYVSLGQVCRLELDPGG